MSDDLYKLEWYDYLKGKNILVAEDLEVNQLLIHDILLPYNGNFVIRIRSNIDLQDGEGLIENYLFFEGTFVYTTR